MFQIKFVLSRKNFCNKNEYINKNKFPIPCYQFSHQPVHTTSYAILKKCCGLFPSLDPSFRKYLLSLLNVA